MAATTLDPNNKTNETLSGGNLVATSSGAGAAAVTRPFTGKHYFEATITTLTGTPSVGFGTQAYATSAVQGALTTSLAYKPSGIVVVNGVTLSTIAAYVAGNRIGVAIDPTLQQVWFRVNNGNWNNNVANDPTTGAGGIDYSSMTLSTLTAAVYASLTANVWTMKFSTPFTDTAPSGFASIDTVQVSKVQATPISELIAISAPTGMPLVADRSPLQPIKRMFQPSGPMTYVSGTVKENGVVIANKKVWVYDRFSGEQIGSTTSASDGTWSVAAVGRLSVLVVCSDPTTYNSIVYDNVTPG